MALHFITTDAERWGTGQERPLTAAELDETIWSLKLAADAAGAAAPISIEAVRIVSGNAMWVDLTDGSSQGPFTLPVASFRGRGDWAAATAYAVNDLISFGNAAYIVIYAHTSGSVFSEGQTDGSGNIAYSKILDISDSVPNGGEQGMVLVKNTGVDRDVVWAFQIGLMPPGGTAGQILHKKSSTYSDIEWVSAISLPVYGQMDVSGVVDIDCANGECQRLSVVGDVTSLVIDNFGAAGRMSKITLEVWNTGSFAFAFPAGTLWAGGTEPTLTAGAGKKDIFVLFTMDGGATIYGNVVGQNYE